jgi:hypothetical protein
MGHVVDASSDEEQAGGGQGEGDADGRDGVVPALEVGVLVHVLEVPLQLQQLLPRPERRLQLRHPGLLESCEMICVYPGQEDPGSKAAARSVCRRGENLFPG